ncbi:MAG: FKBP-type peptidyl-prolyl cis-trans isomerase [Bacteroidota bacterium]
MNLFVSKTFLCCLIALSLFSCKKKNILTQAQADENIINKYITDNNLTATATGSGLYYVIETQGTGAHPTSKSDIIVKYRGYLPDGTQFDQNSTGFATNLSSVVKGWQEGLPYFKKGGKGKLLIPSALGYGANATGSIPANSVLIFDIELVDVL